LVVPAFCRADDTRLDLKGKTIKLSVLGVAGWLPSKLPYEMGPEFAKFAKEKYGYDVSFTYADARSGNLLSEEVWFSCHPELVTVFDETEKAIPTGLVKA
jgi:hypothetical protein